MPDRSDLHSDQVIELVAAVRGGGQPEPAPCRDLLDRMLERSGRDVMAFVGDDQAVPGGQLRDVVAAGQGLQGDDIDRAAQLGPAAAELPGFDAEELSDPGPPLIRKRLPVHQDESGDLMRGDDRARHHGLARSGRRDQHPQIVPGQDLDGRLLRPGQHGRAGEGLRGAGRALIGQVQLAACLRGKVGHGGEHAARHDQPAVDGLVEELQEPGNVPGGSTHPLLLVELRVMHRGSVPQRRSEGGRQVGQLDPDARAEPGPDTVAASGRIFVETGAVSLVTWLPAGTRPALSAARLTSLGVMRPSVDRKDH